MNEMNIQKLEQKTVEESTLEEMLEVAQCIMPHFLKKSNVAQIDRQSKWRFFENQNWHASHRDATCSI